MSERADADFPDDPQSTFDGTADPMLDNRDKVEKGRDRLATYDAATDATIGPDDDPMMTVDPLASFDPEMPPEALFTAYPDDDEDPTSTMNGDGKSTDVGGASHVGGATLGEQELSQISELCQHFESVWKQGDKEPNLVEFVPEDIDPGLRPTLVRKLVSMDVEYRKQQDKSLPVTEYLSQLPESREVVESVFAPSKSSLPRGYGSVAIPKSTAKTKEKPKPFHADDTTTRYRPTDFLARGGLGCVFHAQDEELKRLVALKEILPDHADNERLQEKFLFEAEVTGQLEHPGIVPVYGLGRYEDGQPYYAMRFIRGKSFRDVIEEFHQHHKPLTAATYHERDFRALLRRLIDACEAMHYAHEHGVLHRDIKPDNIMIGSYGETLVVDWGLAMIVEKHDEESDEGVKASKGSLRSTGSNTREGFAVGTPMYMSPEQARGMNDQLDGRTDVYSLGATLFNIISGGYPVEGETARDIVTNVRSGKTKPLRSIVASAPKPLASICRKSMEHNTEDRYATAVELAEDIDRWMSDDVVAAHIGHESWIEWAGRLIRRHRTLTMSVAGSLVAITFIVFFSAIMINNARKNEQIAKLKSIEFKKDAVARYRDSRDAIDTWLVQSSEALGFFPGTQAAQKRLLELATEDYEKLSQRDSEDPELELERGRALVKLGDLNQMQQDFETARAQYKSALSVLTAHKDDNVLSLQFQSEHGNTHTRMGIAFASQEMVPQAESEFRAAIDELTPLTGGGDSLPVRLLAVAHVNAGELSLQNDDLDLAVTSFEQGMKQYARLGNAKSRVSELAIARTSELLGRTYTRQGQHEKALIQFNEAIEELSSLVAAEPDNPDFLDALASAHISQANGFRIRGLEEQEFAALRSAIGHYRALRTALPDVPRYTENLALTLVDIGLALHETGANGQAEANLIEASGLLSDLVAKYGVLVPRLGVQLATCHDAIGQVYIDWKSDPAEATTELAKAINGLQGERLVIAKSHVAQALAREGRTDLCSQFFQQAITEMEQLIANGNEVGDTSAIPDFSNALAHMHYQYAMFLYDQEDAKAEEEYQLARDIWLSLADLQTASYTHALTWLLATCPVDSVRDFESAARFAAEAIELAPENSRYVTTSGLASLLTDDPDTALKLLDQSTSLRGHWIDRDLFVRAMAESTTGESDQAKGSFQEAVAWMDENRPHNTDSRRLREMAESYLSKEEK